MGMESIDKGTFEVGETVQVGYADQTHKDIDPKKTVYQVVSGGQEFIRMGGKEVNARAYLSKFNFAGADQEKLCGVLSGGERALLAPLEVRAYYRLFFNALRDVEGCVVMRVCVLFFVMVYPGERHGVSAC